MTFGSLVFSVVQSFHFAFSPFFSPFPSEVLLLVERWPVDLFLAFPPYPQINAPLVPIFFRHLQGRRWSLIGIYSPPVRDFLFSNPPPSLLFSSFSLLLKFVLFTASFFLPPAVLFLLLAFQPASCGQCLRHILYVTPPPLIICILSALPFVLRDFKGGALDPLALSLVVQELNCFLPPSSP